MANHWLDAPAHHAWLTAEALRLLDFARASRLPQGFGNLDDTGRLPRGAVAQTLTTARMTHSFALAHLHGVPGCRELVEHGVAALQGPLHDALHGGWLAAPEGQGDERKAAYLHAFVALAASSAAVAGVIEAQALLADAIEVIERHFWCEEQGALRESFSRDWRSSEPYCGANSNMHGVEAFLALADVTGQPRWLERALAVVQRLILRQAASDGWRVTEHFDSRWQPLPDYNQSLPSDGFRPYGTTPGHAFEWARLLLHLEASLQRAGLTVPDGLLPAARGLFDSAWHNAWHVDGAPGLVYTLDWDNRPVVRERLHWVHAEASATAAALLKRTGEGQYECCYRRVWDFIAEHFIDRVHGSWHHELDPANLPGARIWGGKPDLYHALQALLLPRLPLAPSLASALAL